MKTKTATATLILAGALFLGCTNPAGAAVRVELTGKVYSKQTVTGPAGFPSKIILVVSTFDRNFWRVECSRGERNLGMCAAFEKGGFIYATGKLRYSGVVLGCGFVSPETVTVIVGGGNTEDSQVNPAE